jgi:nicotinate phosphoribosyltransferase
MTRTATFTLFCRRLPKDRGFRVAAGLEDCLRFLEEFAFDETDLDYLGSIGFVEDDLRRFGSFRFAGEVWAVPEGTVLLANKPLLEVTAPIAKAQLVETDLVNQCTFQTVLATQAARCRIAAAGRIDIVDFNIRRTHGIEAGIAAARLSAMCGFVGTSNVEAA